MKQFSIGWYSILNIGIHTFDHRNTFGTKINCFSCMHEDVS